MLPDRSRHAGAKAGENPGIPGLMRVKELSERDRRWLLIHFLELDAQDRKLRFGTVVSDDVITRYVQRLDFSRDALFGIYAHDQALVAVGHLVFVPRQALPLLHRVTHKTTVAEFGLSVAPHVRGLGMGGKLFERAAVLCRNRDVDTLAMPCLAENPAVMHLARKAGMEIRCEYGEVNAYLRLPPGKCDTVLHAEADVHPEAPDHALTPTGRRTRERRRRFPHGR